MYFLNLVTIFACVCKLLNGDHVAIAGRIKRENMMKVYKGTNDTKFIRFEDTTGDKLTKEGNFTVMKVDTNLGDGRIAFGNISTVAKNIPGVANGTTLTVGNFTTFGFVAGKNNNGNDAAFSKNISKIFGLMGNVENGDGSANNAFSVSTIEGTINNPIESKVMLGRNMRVHTKYLMNNKNNLVNAEFMMPRKERKMPIRGNRNRALSKHAHAHKRLHFRKPSMYADVRDDELVILPNVEMEVSQRELPGRHYNAPFQWNDNYELNDNDNSLFGSEETTLNSEKLPQDFPLCNVMSLAHMIFSRMGNNNNNVNKSPIGFGAEEITYVVGGNNKPESKLANFLRNARSNSLMDFEKPKVDFMSAGSMAPIAEDSAELQIRCPIHHGGDMDGNNFLGTCTCSIVHK